MNQPRIRPGCRSRDDPEILIVGRAANRVWRSKLRPVEDVKELGPELKAEPFIGRETRSFEYRKIKIINSLGAQPRIHARLIPECEVGRR